MHFTKKNASEKRIDFTSALKSGKLLRFPGAYNPLSAKLISEIGFDGVYISGGVMANDLGLPDIGLTTLEQVSYRASQITRVTDLPTIVDADTGFKDCKKTISTFEAKGLAGCTRWSKCAGRKRQGLNFTSHNTVNTYCHVRQADILAFGTILNGPAISAAE